MVGVGAFNATWTAAIMLSTITTTIKLSAILRSNYCKPQKPGFERTRTVPSSDFARNTKKILLIQIV
ncbi:MAG: hypothetical protein M3299_16050 [Thermoproteota archaeon]|nr:hypothetical protein [Thermoproteota archaeon]